MRHLQHESLTPLTHGRQPATEGHVLPKIFRPTYVAPDGVRRTQRTYYVKLKGIDGKWRRKALTTDYATSRRLADKLTADAGAERHGLPVLDAAGGSLADHLAAWRDYLLTRGVTAAYADKQMGRVRRVLDAGGSDSLARLSEDAVLRGIASLQRSGVTTAAKHPRTVPVGHKTAGYLLTACKGFASWAKRKRRLPFNPLADTRGRAERAKGRKLEPVRPRRALTRDEFGRLLAAAEASPRTFGRMAGADRAMVYLTAIHTGFRATEIAGLTASACALAGDRPTITTRGYGRAFVQRVSPGFAAKLKTYLQDRPAEGRIWPGGWASRTAEMIAADLRAAGIDPEGPPAVDFHSLRRTAGTLLIAAGADLKSVQHFMRHSTITLTMDLYVEVTGGGYDAALASLPV